MKKYLDCYITTNGGTEFSNPLPLREVYLISKMAQENKKIVVKIQEVSKEQYKQIFG